MGERVRRLAKALQAHGVELGSRVGVMATNSPEYVEVYYACARLGACFVPLNFRAKREELVHDIGVSSYSIECIEDLVYLTGEMPAVNQIEWSPFGHSPRMLDFCRENDIIIQAWSPLTRASRLNDDKLGTMAARYGKTPAQLLIRWNLQLGVVPIPKANHVQHQRENLNVFDFEISGSDMVKLNGLNEHFSALRGLQYL
jgi:diketogulonate reductase-like aldo/keto reductase